MAAEVIRSVHLVYTSVNCILHSVQKVNKANTIFFSHTFDVCSLDYEYTFQTRFIKSFLLTHTFPYLTLKYSSSRFIT